MLATLKVRLMLDTWGLLGCAAYILPTRVLLLYHKAFIRHVPVLINKKFNHSSKIDCRYLDLSSWSLDCSEEFSVSRLSTVTFKWTSFSFAFFVCMLWSLSLCCKLQMNCFMENWMYMAYNFSTYSLIIWIHHQLILKSNTNIIWIYFSFTPVCTSWYYHVHDFV